MRVAHRSFDTSSVYLVDVDRSTGDVLGPLLEFVRISLESFDDPSAFLEACERDPMQGCLLLSARLPQLSGFEVYRRLKGRGDELPTIFLGHAGDVSSAVQAMKLGAVDYFERPLPYPALVERIQTVLRHETTRLRRRHAIDELRRRLGDLTLREKQVLEQVVDGRLNKQIARRLHISQKTVEMHRARVMAKLGARTLAELVRKWCASRCDDVLGCEFLDELGAADSRERPRVGHR